MGEARTFKARGEGGCEWEFEVPPVGSFAEERFREKIARGELVIVDGDSPFPPIEPPAGDTPIAEPGPDGAPAEPDIPPAPADPSSEQVEPIVPVEGEMPDGTIEEVLAWVGDDKDRAAYALEHEQAKGETARSTLTLKLESLISA